MAEQTTHFATGKLHEIVKEIGALARFDIPDALKRLAAEISLLPDNRKEPAYDLLHAAVDLGLIGAFLEAATIYVTTKTRPWPGTGYERAADDPHVIGRFGKFRAAFHGLESLLDEATEAAAVGRGDAPILAAAARGQAIHVGKSFISETIELLGASATSQKHGFDGYWRDFTNHARQHPPSQSAETIGFALIAAALPSPSIANSQF